MSKEDARKARATLELDLAQGPPRGALTAVNGRRWPFVGWIALASALEAWRDGTFDANPDPGHKDEITPDQPNQLAGPREVGE